MGGVDVSGIEELSPEIIQAMDASPEFKEHVLREMMKAKISSQFGSEKMGFQLHPFVRDDGTLGQMRLTSEGMVEAKPTSGEWVDPYSYRSTGKEIVGFSKYGTRPGPREPIDIGPKEQVMLDLQTSGNVLDWKKHELTLAKFDRDVKDSEEKKLLRKMYVNRAAGTVTADIGRGIEVLEENMNRKVLPTTAAGPFAAILQYVPTTDAHKLERFATSVKSNISIDQLNQMRESSPTGGALGQVPVQQQIFLMQLLGSLEINQSPPVLLDNMRRIYNVYMDIIHGEGNGGERYRLTFDETGKTVPGGADWQGIPGMGKKSGGLSNDDIEKMSMEELKKYLED
jgi:hypothetical protein